MITKERVSELLSYEKNTGDFYWRVKRRGRYARPGCKAGTTSRYILIGIDGKQYPAHQLVWLIHYGYIPKEIDHVNRIKTDNRLCNLRECSRSENTGNVPLRSTNTSGYRGIWYAKHCGRWRAAIKIEGKGVHIGYFDTPEDAARAYNEKAREYFGDFAYINEV